MISHKNTVPVITLDGPSGTGKGTLCHLLAKQLSWHFLDSGAIYRVFALAAEQEQLDLQSREALVSLGYRLDLRFEGESVLLKGIVVNDLIRSEHCGQSASKLAAIPEVREALLMRQRAFAKPPGLVTDGRDMGTVVFPDAALKIYLFATPEARAMRRYFQLKKSGKNDSLAQVIDELAQRDARDMARAYAPLKPAEDSIAIDTTGLTVEEVFHQVLQLVLERGLV
jgi:cytidylate kinase